MTVSTAYHHWIIATLRSDVAVTAICGGRVYDNAPANPHLPYITLGAADFTPEDAQCIAGRRETVQVDIWSRKNSERSECRDLMDAVESALHGVSGDLGVHALVGVRLVLGRLLDDPDGITKHGVMQFEAKLEKG